MGAPFPGPYCVRQCRHSPATPSLVMKGTAVTCQFKLENVKNSGAPNCGLNHSGTFVLSTHCFSDWFRPWDGLKYSHSADPCHLPFATRYLGSVGEEGAISVIGPRPLGRVLLTFQPQSHFRATFCHRVLVGPCRNGK